MGDDSLAADEIAQALTTSESTVRRWLKRYDECGVAGLHDLPRSGRRPIEPHLTDMLEAQAGQTPDVYGYLQTVWTVWTVALLALHLWDRLRVSEKPCKWQSHAHG